MAKNRAAASLGRRRQEMERERLGDEEYRKLQSERGRLGGVAARGKSGRKSKAASLNTPL